MMSTTNSTKDKIIETATSVFKTQYKKSHSLEDAAIYTGRWAAGRMKYVAPQERQAWRWAMGEAALSLKLKVALRQKMMSPLL